MATRKKRTSNKKVSPINKATGGKGLAPKTPPPPPDAKPIPPKPKGHVIVIKLTTDASGVNNYTNYSVSDPTMSIDMIESTLQVALAVVKNTKAGALEAQRKIQQRAAAMAQAQMASPQLPKPKE